MFVQGEQEENVAKQADISYYYSNKIEHIEINFVITAQPSQAKPCLSLAGIRHYNSFMWGGGVGRDKVKLSLRLNLKKLNLNLKLSLKLLLTFNL